MHFFQQGELMERPAILSQIKNDIKSAKVGTVFVPIDFALLTDKKTASVCTFRHSDIEIFNFSVILFA